MRGIRKLVAIFALIAVLTALCAVQAGATENGTMWFESVVAEDGVTVTVWSDTDAASGVVAFEYDKKALKFQDLELEETYIAMHSLNAKIPGQVKISWVAPAQSGSQQAHVLMRLHFTGTSAESIRISGTAYTASGDSIGVAALDLVALKAAIEKAEAKVEADYTAESFAALQTALQEAKALLERDDKTPAQISATAEKLEQALQGLEEPVPEVVPTTPMGGNESNGSMAIVVAVVAVCAAAAVVVVILLKKRGNKKCA